ncbi:MAG: alpha-N-arabinofuranosidase [Thermorudis peleae]|nr:alpha-N-arabinofuranosidase [Thermorudis peleae]
MKPATIVIDDRQIIGIVDRKIFGGFIEHLGRCIYGGIFDPNSPLSNEQGFRKDVADAIRNLNIAILRWPGGNFASTYHWQDGVGPLEKRTKRLNLAWGGIDPNIFGTDEFLAFCHYIGAEPYICINMGTGTFDEAQGWVEYCNWPGGTYWSDYRRANGHEQPYRVRYWGLGNEMYGDWQIGALDANTYVARAREFVKIMREVDPEIQFVSCGLDGLSDWDLSVLRGLAKEVHYHSIHIYTGHPDYYLNVTAPLHLERCLTVCRGYIEKVRYEQQIKRPIKIAVDEWNVWYRERGKEAGYHGLEEQYDFADALAIATYLNIFLRNCDIVGMANIAQLVNAIAPIITTPDGIRLQTIYYPYMLYAHYTKTLSLRPIVECSTYTLDTPAEPYWTFHVENMGNIPYLDVAVTCDDAKREFVLAVVNRARNDSILTSIVFREPVKLKEVRFIDEEVINHQSLNNGAILDETAIGMQGTILQYSLHPASITIFYVCKTDR